MPTIEELIDQVENVLGHSYGILDVFEGSRVRLQAGFAKVGKGGLFSKKTVKGKWVLKTLMKHANPAEKIDEVEVQVSRQAEEATHELTLPVVPDNEEKYIVRYEFHVKDQRIPGPYEFRVWPQSLTLKAEITADSDQERFKYNVVQAHARAKRGLLTDTNGDAVIPLTTPGKSKITAGSPWKIDSWTEEKARKRTCKVSRQPITAKVYSHRVIGRKPEQAFKQWVNERTDYDKHNGHIARFVVGAFEDEGVDDPSQRLATEGQEIFLRVTLPKENSKRSKPKTGLMLDWELQDPDSAYDPDNPTDRIYTTKLALGPDGEPCTFWINMGLAGGDKCKIEVGVTDTYSDDVVHLENWRRIPIEIFTPDPAISQSGSSIANGAFTPDFQKTLKGTLDDAFIELVPLSGASRNYTEDEISSFLEQKKGSAGLAKCLIHDASYLNVDGVTIDQGDKVCIWEPYLLYEDFRAHLTNESLPKNAMSSRWADSLISTLPSSENPSPLAISFENATAQDKDLPGHLFKFDPVAADGSFGVQALKWRVTHYKDENGAWKTMGLGAPGTDKFFHTWKTVALDDEAEVDAFFEFTNSRKLKVKIPARGGKEDTDPGHFLNKDGTEFKVQYNLKLSLGDFQPAMAASKGQVVGGTGFGKSDQFEVCCGLSHEMGHNLGISYMQNLGPGDMPGGTDGRGRGTPIPGIPFPKNVHDGGRVFADKGMAGAHCADKVQEVANEEGNQDILKLPHYTVSYLLGIRDSHPALFNAHVEARDREHCLMWAETHGTRQPHFCDECLVHVKATDARNLSKDWTK